MLVASSAEEAEMPDERTHRRKRTTTLVTAYDPYEDYTQPAIDIEAVTNYLKNHDLFEEWLSTHPEAA
jgi:hypothetical protein